QRVLLPITFVMLLIGILRHYAIELLQANPKPIPLVELRQQRILVRSACFRNNCQILNRKRFESRQRLLIQALSDGRYLSQEDANSKSPANTKDGNAVAKNSSSASNPPNPLDPANMEGMMDGLKKQMVMMIPQTVIMGWINAFFYGFVCVKLPFPLPIGFKQMLQRGIETPNMDITWVSSLSWYFLNLFGLNSIYRLLLGDENAADGSAALAMGGASNMGLSPQAMDYKKLYQTEIENLKLIDHQYVCDEDRNLKLDNIEHRVLELYGQPS
ncbi:hypothetical protein O181_069987, partial [Austropuccinia psidii MF-1]|nr:hypothetical protein [Austropuccinia psidii MF-1]